MSAKKKITRAELIEKWLQALESGKYKQGAGQLMEEGGKYCCLGVLCDVAVKEGLIKKFDGDRGYLTSTVSRLVGLQTDGSFKFPVDVNIGRGRYSLHNLAQANDWGVSFKRIAKIIRKQLAEKNFAKS